MPQRLGCLAYPLSFTGGFVVVILFAAAIGLSASKSFFIAVLGSVAAFFFAWLKLRSDKANESHET